jgi:hypothetical protein
MDNEQLKDMSDEDFTASIKLLQSHAETKATEAFQSGTEKRSTSGT